MKKFIKDLGEEAEECPFCKGYNLSHNIYMSAGCIECLNCGCIGPESTPDYDIEAAVKVWNDRTAK